MSSQSYQVIQPPPPPPPPLKKGVVLNTLISHGREDYRLGVQFNIVQQSITDNNNHSISLCPHDTGVSIVRAQNRRHIMSNLTYYASKVHILEITMLNKPSYQAGSVSQRTHSSQHSTGDECIVYSSVS